MAEAILDGTGSGNLARVNANGRLLVDLGGDVTISGVNIDSITIQETSPVDDTKNNPAWSFEYTGSVVSRVVQFIGGGSFSQDITYDIGSAITAAGSWY